LSRLFGFSLNEWGFVKEEGPLKTDVEGIYACGGALEPMSIKDAILTGFGAGFAVTSKGRYQAGSIEKDERLYREEAPEVCVGDESAFESCLFYLGTEDAGTKMFYELMSWKFIEAARRLKEAGKTVYVLDRNISVPSYGELAYEQARREGVLFIHLEEEDAVFDGRTVRITGGVSELSFTADKIVRLDDYADAFKDKEFLSVYRSEPQLRWSPTRWGRKRYHVGFIRHPRAARWEAREILGALGEMRLDEEEERVFPEVDEERCSGCGSCRNACPHSAIEMELRETAVALFGPDATTAVPIAHIKTDVCVGCGLCASTCPSEVIAYTP
jgi:NAD-dependent dihydropyrimidine dehydrogenase PreA subunit